VALELNTFAGKVKSQRTLASFGLLIESENDLGGAIIKFKEIVGKYPLNIDGHFHLGRIYYNENKTTEAISELEQVVAVSPLNSNALYILGLAYYRNGEREKALSALNKVLELNPGNKDVLTKISEINSPKPEETKKK